MRDINDRGILAKAKANRIEMVRWLVIVAYFGILYLMANNLWHASRFHLFMASFVALPLLVFIIFKYLEKYETGNKQH